MKQFNHWARVVAGVVLLLSIAAGVFFAGFFTEREYGDVFAAFDSSPLSIGPAEDTCYERVCSPAGRFGQHCRLYEVPC